MRSGVNHSGSSSTGDHDSCAQSTWFHLTDTVMTCILYWSAYRPRSTLTQTRSSLYAIVIKTKMFKPFEMPCGRVGVGV